MASDGGATELYVGRTQERTSDALIGWRKVEIINTTNEKRRSVMPLRVGLLGLVIRVRMRPFVYTDTQGFLRRPTSRWS